MSVDTKQAKELCLALIHADTEDEVILLLSEAGFWDDPGAWAHYGAYENNYNTIGNQQSRPEAALVEKLVNSVDARLMNEALVRAVEPEGEDAPQSLRCAVARFFDEKMKETDPSAGLVREWSGSKRTEIARGITLAATGKMPDDGYPSLTIVDCGEGQSPDQFESTFLSLTGSNKMRIAFVQGKYNMGGTGVLKFCGRRNLQLIVSRRNPAIYARERHTEQGGQWGYTVVRREDPSGGRRNSVYSYLAPAHQTHGRESGVLRFDAKTLPLFPEGKRPYAREAEWGTLVKLYEFGVTGFRSNILRKGGLLSRLDLLLPQIALPVRLHECRAGYKGHEGSFETTLCGLSVRLDDDKAENLEFEASSSRLNVSGEPLVATIYAFKKGRRETYTRSEGIIFVMNGQTHGHMTSDFFRRTSVGLSYLSDSILVTIDCGELSGRAREDLFMNSRDRLSGGDLREDIEAALEQLLRGHEQLRALKERRRREEVEEMTAEDKPLEQLLQELLARSPALARLLLPGAKISDPFKRRTVAETDDHYEGKRYPTFFRFAGEDYGTELQRDCHINMRFRIAYETDASNDYFSRAVDRGEFRLQHNTGSKGMPVEDFVLNLANGIATLTVRLPGNCREGDKLFYVCEVTDRTRQEPFTNKFELRVRGKADTGAGGSGRSKSPSKDGGNEREAPRLLSLPKVNRVTEDVWEKYTPPFDKYTALRIKHVGSDEENGGGEEIYDFYVNVDNIYLKAEQKRTKLEVGLVEARFVYGLVILGLAMIRQDADLARTGEREGPDSEKSTPNVEDKVEEFSRAAGSVILPIIESLGNLQPDELNGLHVAVEGE